MKKKPRYKFNSNEILKDFKNLNDFREAFGVTRATYLRGFTNSGRYRGKYSHIPRKYIIDKQTSAKLLLCEGVMIAKDKLEATHIVEISGDRLQIKTNKKE